MKTIRLKWTGVRPLIMHNSQLVDAQNEFTQQINAIRKNKRSKDQSEDNIDEIAFLEWKGGLYWDKELGAVVPSDNIERCIQQAAAKSRMGKQFAACVLCDEPLIPIKYDGPKTIEKLYANPWFVFRKPVVVQRNRIMRVRPYFPEWEIEFDLLYDETEIKSADTIATVCETAGALVGIGDWRPKYGRFESKVI